VAEVEITLTRDEATIQLGESYKDAISGFAGVAMSRHEYLYGCTRITLQTLSDAGSVLSETFDAPALVAVDGTKFESARTGGPRPIPTPRSTG